MPARQKANLIDDLDLALLVLHDALADETAGSRRVLIAIEVIEDVRHALAS